MLLTALFAFNIGSIHSSTTLQYFSIEHSVGLFLLIAIGLCIDISKYLFWFYRKRHVLFLLLSVLLVCFSWAASVAFFTAKEKESIRVYQSESSQYIAHKVTIASLKSTIAEKQKLLEKRLSSNYHNQWDKGEEMLEEINSLNQTLKEHIALSDSIGIESAQSQLNTSALFMMLSSLLSLSFSSVANIVYGMLSLIVEVCALGVMSLAQIVNVNEGQGNKKNLLDKNKTEKIRVIKHDILSEKIEPLISKVIKEYSISHKEAKSIMTALEAEGKIMIKRNRYYLLK